jgi:hypothetical protein
MKLVESTDVTPLDFFFFVGLDDERSLQKERGYMTRIICLHFGCCCPHKET